MGTSAPLLLAHCTPKWEFLAHRLHVATKSRRFGRHGHGRGDHFVEFTPPVARMIFFTTSSTYDQMYAEKDKKDFQAMMKSECSGDFQAIQDVTTSYPPCGHLLGPEKSNRRRYRGGRSRLSSSTNDVQLRDRGRIRCEV